jgi:hypothetical protein
MRFWVRELAGWLLVGLGLVVFYLCYEFLRSGRVVETGALTVIGVFVFRGGIHLLKMAVAARVCLEARDATAEAAPAAPGRVAVSRQPAASAGRRGAG